MTSARSGSTNFIQSVDLGKPGEHIEGLERVQVYLNRYGYLAEGGYQPGTLDAVTSSSLQKYQRFFDLPDTGAFDETTKEQMTQSRCLMPDLWQGVAFARTCAWDRWSLSYTMDTGTEDCFGEFLAVRNALATWAAATPLTFTEVGVDQTPDIRIGWRPANDPDHSMVGGVLAHADFPPNCSIVTTTLPKPVHFDDTEHTWSIGAVAGAFDVETVALHELGHILGLGHSSVSGAVMQPTIAPGAVKRSLTDDDITGVTGNYPTQSDWRWCNKCQGLFFGPQAAASRCPAGSTHTPPAQSGSGRYLLAHGLPATTGWQSDWRWCNKCQGLFFGPQAAASRCPAGSTHTPPAQSGSGNYSLMHNAGTAPGQQSNWRWCNKCHGLYFEDNVASPPCAAGGAHARPSQSGSGNYSLVHRAS
ncbi:matrixin family metalloprotease [Streptomyces sp. NPDC041068]|uniref:matrixin family metalloprotease n=1 Tax=Streptomyces sp. NPDC041068 TaxID=3155130 RepID=UPI0034052BFC